MNDGKLMIDPDNKEGNDFVLSPLSPNRFKVVGAPDLEIVFVRPIAGGPMQVKIIRGGKPWGTYDAVQSVTPTSVQLAEFTGKYSSDELAGATYTLSVKNGKLTLRGWNGITVFSDGGQVLSFSQSSGREAPEDFPLIPVFADSFVNPGGDSFIIKFSRNQQNAISGFTLSASLVRGVRFNKQ